MECVTHNTCFPFSISSSADWRLNRVSAISSGVVILATGRTFNIHYIIFNVSGRVARNWESRFTIRDKNTVKHKLKPHRQALHVHTAVFCQQEFVSWKMRISQNQPRAVRKLLVAPFLPENAWPLSFGPHACVITPCWVVPGDDKNPLLLYTWATPPKSALWENNRLAALFYYKYSRMYFPRWV